MWLKAHQNWRQPVLPQRKEKVMGKGDAFCAAAQNVDGRQTEARKSGLIPFYDVRNAISTCGRCLSDQTCSSATGEWMCIDVNDPGEIVACEVIMVIGCHHDAKYSWTRASSPTAKGGKFFNSDD